MNLIHIGSSAAGERDCVVATTDGTAYVRLDRTDLQCVSGVCLLTRRELFAAAGEFASEYQGDLAAADYGLKVRQLGYRVRYVPASEVVRHRANGAVPLACTPDEERRFRQQWTGRIPADEVRAYLQDGFVVARSAEGLRWLPWAIPAPGAVPAPGA